MQKTMLTSLRSYGLLRGLMFKILIALFILEFHFPLVNAQQRTWTLVPHRINFSPAGSGSLPGASSSSYITGNGAYDESGNLLFYVQDLEVYKADGTSLGTLTPYINSTPDCFVNYHDYLQNEIGIVPVPGSCKKFYIIWVGASACNPSIAARYALVDLEGGTPTLTNPASNVALGGGNFWGGSGSIAISKLQVDGTRRIYIIGSSSYNIVTLSNTGFTNNYASFQTLPASFDYPPGEVELSPDGTKIAWGTIYGGGGRTAHSTLNTDGSINSTNFKVTTYTNGYISRGAEFGPDGKLYTCVYTNSSYTASIKVIASPGSSNAYSNFIDSSILGVSDIELGYDGLMYVIDNNGKLQSFGTSSTSLTVAHSSLTFYSNATSGWNTGFRLPDQIDGEDYSYFFGTPKFTYTSLGVKNNAVTVASSLNGVSQINYRVYNCYAITLDPASVNATSYKLTVYSSDQYGNQVTGGTTMNYAGSWTSGAYPTTLDLRTLQSNYMQSNYGYFKAVVELKDNCNNTSSKEVLLNLSAITSNSSSFLFNTGDGTLVTPSTNPASPTPVGQYYLGVNGASSTGSIDFYHVLIERVNSSGVVLSTVCNPANITLPNGNPASMGSLALNFIVRIRCGGIPDYFADPANVNLIYKVTFTVGNVCGTHSSYGYFTNTDPFQKKGTFGGNSLGTVSYPNPTTGKVTVSYTLPEASDITLSICNAQGNVINTVIKDAPRAAGDQMEDLDLSGLPEGIYMYHIEGSQPIQGRIVKTR